MFGSVRFGGRKLTVVSLLCFFVFLAVCLFALKFGVPDTVVIGEVAYSLSVENDGDVERFIAACGADVDELISDKTVKVPKEWNAFFEGYAQLQKAQGLDISRYKGKEAKELIYSLKNSGDYAAVLICDGRIAAAHLSRMDGTDDIRGLIQ